MKEFLYQLVYALFYAFSKLPYKALYGASDCFYIILYHLVGYRREIVRRNLATSFPDKSQEELRYIERGFYHWLCDYFVETVKLMSVSRQELLQHIEFKGVEQLEECFDNGQMCAAILGHYGNWEFLSATGLAFQRHHEAVCGLIYHPLRSDLFDRMFIKLRQSTQERHTALSHLIQATRTHESLRIHSRPRAPLPEHSPVAALPQP